MCHRKHKVALKRLRYSVRARRVVVVDDGVVVDAEDGADAAGWRHYCCYLLHAVIADVDDVVQLGPLLMLML